MTVLGLKNIYNEDTIRTCFDRITCATQMCHLKFASTTQMYGEKTSDANCTKYNFQLQLICID